MHRPSPGPHWPPTDDPVENSLRRAYLRAPQSMPSEKTGGSDHLHDLLQDVTEVLRRRDSLRHNA